MDSQARREGRRNLLWEIVGGSFVGGLFVAVVSPFIVDWIREGMKTQGVEGFWGPIVLALLAVVAVLALVVLVTVSIISPKGRERWRQFGKWLWSWRPVSARRHDRVTAKLIRELVASNLARKELAIKADEALDQIRGSIPDVALVLSEQLADDKQRVDTIMNAVEDLSKIQKELQGKQQKLEAMIVARGPQISAEAGAQQRPAPIPSPAPRWRIIAPSQRDDQNQDDGNYLLKNLIENSVARDVRLENDGVGYFEFEDGAFWPELSGRRTGAFAGQIVDVDEVGDVRLRLTYLDADGRSQVIRYWMNRDGRVREIHQAINPWGDETPF